MPKTYVTLPPTAPSDTLQPPRPTHQGTLLLQYSPYQEAVLSRTWCARWRRPLAVSSRHQPTFMWAGCSTFLQCTPPPCTLLTPSSCTSRRADNRAADRPTCCRESGYRASSPRRPPREYHHRGGGVHTERLTPRGSVCSVGQVGNRLYLTCRFGPLQVFATPVDYVKQYSSTGGR